MFEAVSIAPPVSPRGSAHMRSTRWLALLALSALWLAACASVPATASDCAAGQTQCTSGSRHKVVADTDEWKHAADFRKPAGDPRGMMVLIQSNMDRLSARQPAWPAPTGITPDPLLHIVDAYADFLHGDFKGMDASIAIAEQAAGKLYLKSVWQEDKAGKESFSKNLAVAARSPLPLVRLYAALRDVDGGLFSTLGDPYTRTIFVMRGSPSPLDGTWASLPCRTVIGRVPQFVAATSELKSLGGPVLDCPVDGPVDYAKDEMLALHPAQLMPHVTPPAAKQAFVAPGMPAPPPPGSREAALDEMATHPQQAAPILEHYAHVDALGELDYALFLHSFEPRTPARDATIRALQADLQKKAMASPGKVSDFPPTPYDGTDASLLNIIRLASETGVADSDSAFYAIPCAVLTARPALTAATDEYWGSNRDNFMPRSGCQWGRGGTISGFPGKTVDAFETASTEADGNFIASYEGSMVYGLEATQNASNQQMRLNPRAFLPAPNLDYPYQVWGYTSLNNYIVSLRLRKLYLAAHDQLATYYRKHMQLDDNDNNQAAKAALFAVTWGANCGGVVPTTSLRKMLLEHAPLHDIEHQLRGRPVGAVDNDASASRIETMLQEDNFNSPLLAQQLYGSSADAPEIDACAKYAGLDPLLLVAVDDPSAFGLVLQHEPNVNVHNAIGKTALMEAAQFNQLAIVDLLLTHHARINATLWGSQNPYMGAQLGDDARTALMYAAANGSLDLIKALLDAGADPYQADTKGRRAIDYLLGYGPTPPNPHLSKHQREQAAQWLF